MRWLRALLGIKKCKNHGTEQEHAKDVPTVNKSKRWLLWKPSALEMSKNVDRRRSMSARYVHPEDCIYLKYYRRQWAAIRIQSAFRGFLARRARRALKAIVRIQAIFRGRRVRRILQAYSQLRIQEPKKRDWCDEHGSIGEIEARQQCKHAAAIRRERAMAYALYRRAMRADSKGPEFWQLWEKWLAEQEVDAYDASRHYHISSSKAMMMTPTETANYYNDYYHSGPISPAPSKSSSYGTHHGYHDFGYHARNTHSSSRRRRTATTRGSLHSPIMADCKPGYMEGTISMRAKCRNSENGRSCQQMPSPNRRRHTNYPIACMHNHNNNILLQCN